MNQLIFRNLYWLWKNKLEKGINEENHYYDRDR